MRAMKKRDLMATVAALAVTRITSGVAQPCGVASPQGTRVTTVGPVIIDFAGESFTLTSGGQVAVNGTTDGSTSNVIELLYWNSRVYQRVNVWVASATVTYGPDYNDWYYKAVSANPWRGPVCDPRLTLPTSNLISITSAPYNAVGDGSTDNTTAIQNAFNDAYTNGKSVFIPAGNFFYSNNLTVNGITVFGTGSASILTCTVQANSSLELTGSGAFLTCFQIVSQSTSRLAPYQAAIIWPYGCTNFTVQNMLLQGASSATIFCAEASYGVIQWNTVWNSWADSITQTKGTNYVTVNGNRIYNSGDDNISKNSYTGYSPSVNNIVITNNTGLLQNWGRCSEISGGSNITFNTNFFLQDNAVNPFAGFFCATENGAYQTQAVT